MSLLNDVYTNNMYGDAFKNNFEVIFYGLPAGVVNLSDLTFGALGNTDNNDLFTRNTGLRDGYVSFRTKSITIPSAGVNTTDIDFMGTKYKIPTSKVNIDTQITLEFRVDSFWNVYRDLCTWRNKLANPATGNVGFDSPSAFNDLTTSAYGLLPRMHGRAKSMVVYAIGKDNGVDYYPVVWTFSLPFPITVGEVALDYADGNPVTVSLTMGFHEMSTQFKVPVVKVPAGKVTQAIGRINPFF